MELCDDSFFLKRSLTCKLYYCSNTIVRQDERRERKER